eukprot:TRINITY_DN1999_c0_g2_i1.p1 TRINITY_DN1999_c0_g2~~TRINITY_DN1999_c0_g2_i1.p1  ORF type:complete len:276 (-),score=53.11 TRINITY_DN1999_c0_g2_i1:112-939(-)
MDETSEISVSLLEHVPLFTGCSQEVLAAIAKPMKPRNFTMNERLVVQGDTANEMFFIIKGKVSIIADEKHIADLGPGSFFGEMGILYSVPRKASVVALSDGQLLILSKPDFEVVKKDHPQIIEKVQLIADKRFEWFIDQLKASASSDPANYSAEQIEKFRQVFCDVDIDNSGSIDINELGTLLKRLSGKEFSQIELNMMMRKMDIDKNESVDFDEFISGLRHLKWIVGEEKSRSVTKSSPESSESGWKKYQKHLLLLAIVLLAATLAHPLFSSLS